MTTSHSASKQTTSQSSPQPLSPPSHTLALRKIQRVERETVQKYLLRRAA